MRGEVAPFLPDVRRVHPSTLVNLGVDFEDVDFEDVVFFEDVW